MSRTLFLAFALLLGAVVLAHGASDDICNSKDTGFNGKEQAVVCYTGNFLVKMLGELNSGQNKTVEHVRVHLLPYLGGVKTLNDLRSDDPDTPTCKVCYADNATADGLTSLRNSLSKQQLQDYDNVDVCYASLTQRVLSALPHTGDLVWLVPDTQHKNDPFAQVVDMFKQFFADKSYDVASCPSHNV